MFVPPSEFDEGKQICLLGHKPQYLYSKLAGSCAFSKMAFWAVAMSSLRFMGLSLYNPFLVYLSVDRQKLQQFLD
jgi:hypothetical protein